MRLTLQIPPYPIVGLVALGEGLLEAVGEGADEEELLVEGADEGLGGDVGGNGLQAQRPAHRRLYAEAHRRGY